MEETYCGKSCAQCEKRTVLTCAGCKAGPGRQLGGDCEIAKCVRDKGHTVCETCAFHATCGPRRGREGMPDRRIRKLEAQAQRYAAIARRAPVLGKWLWLIFWLVILRIPVALLTNGSIAGADTPMAAAGQILNAGISIVSGAAFWKMAEEEARYRTAGLCMVIAAMINLVLELVPNVGEAVFLLASIPAAIVALVGEYQEFQAHAAVLAEVDDVLSRKWESLWKWNIGLFAGIFGSLLVMLLIPILGVLAILAATIGILIVSILKLVYLYRMAKLFLGYTQ